MYSLSLSQQKLMLHIFAMIKPSDTELPRYEMSIYEFLKLCGVDPHNGSMYKQVKKNIEDIANAKVQWIRLAGTQKITMFRWLSSATIDEGTGKIVLTLDQSLKPHLIQLKEFYTTMNITYTLPMKSQYSLKIYELCKSYQNLYITKKEKGEPLVWNIETLKKQVDCNAANWAHVRRTVLDKAKSEINGHTDIYFDYEVYEKDRQRVIAIAVTIEPVDKQVADDKRTRSQNPCPTGPQQEGQADSGRDRHAGRRPERADARVWSRCPRRRSPIPTVLRRNCCARNWRSRQSPTS